ncbi:MAG: glucan biosynthesis protein [Elusimicrobia bacterium]|nr:glucan biosynthesis protein [Elusimicrobiota bacterium]
MVRKGSGLVDGWVRCAGFLFCMLFMAIGTNLFMAGEVSAADAFYDTFNDGEKPNNMGGNSGSMADATASCSDAFTEEAGTANEGEWALKLVYNRASAWAGYWSFTKSDQSGRDLSSYSYISFWAKGTAGGEKFKIELQDTSYVSQKANITSYSGFENGISSTTFENIVIPLSDFPSVNKSNLKQVNIIFDQSPDASTIYIDDIRFITNSTPDPYPNTPTLTDPGVSDDNGNYLVEWSSEAASGATIYELWESEDIDFPVATVNTYWPSAPEERMFKTEDATYYYKVRSWADVPESDGVSSQWSNIVDMNVTIVVEPPAAPTLSDPGTTDDNGAYFVEWSTVTNGVYYELWESLNSSMPESEYDSGNNYWLYLTNSQLITHSQNNTYYYKVRAWDDLPQNDGIHGDWSSIEDMNVVIASTAPTTPVLTDPGDTDDNGNYTLQWSTSTGAALYEIRESTDSEIPEYYDPTRVTYYTANTYINILKAINATYYYKVRGWSDTPENDGMPSEWSNDESICLTIEVTPPDTPTLTYPSGETSSLNVNTKIEWTDEGASGAGIYELWESTNSDFSTSVSYYWETVPYLWRYYTTSNTTYYYKVRSWTAPPEQDGQTNFAFSGTEALYVNYEAVDLDYSDLEQKALELAQVDFEEPYAPSIPQLDFNPNKYEEGLVFEEEVAIKGDRIYDDAIWWIELRPRAGYAKDPIDAIYLYDDVLGKYVKRTFVFENYDYSDPIITPPIEVGTLPDAAKVNCEIKVGHLVESVSNWPELYNIRGAGYFRFISNPPFRMGATFRPLIHHKDSNKLDAWGNYEESYPRVKEAYFRILSSTTINMSFLFDSVSFTGAVSIDYSPGLPAFKYVKSHMFPRRDINIVDFSEGDEKQERVGFGGFSSMFWKGEETDVGDECHDCDNIIIGYDNDQVTEYKFDKAGPLIEEDYNTDETKAPVFYRMEQQDKYVVNYREWWGGDYGDRSSFKVEIISAPASNDLRVRLLQFGTNDEFTDNVVVHFGMQSSTTTEPEVITATTSVTEGIYAEYTLTADQPIVDYDDFEDNDISPRKTSLDWWNYDAYSDFSISTEQAHTGTHSLKVPYQKTSAWQCLNAEISTETARRDISGSNSIVMWVYGEEDILAKLKDIYNNEYDIDTKTAGDPSGWTKLTFTYDHLRDNNIDLTNIDRLMLFIAPGDSGASGTIYIDDVCTTWVEEYPFVFDNFEDNDLTADGKYGVEWSAGGEYTCTATTQTVHSGEYALKVDYAKTDYDQYFNAYINRYKFPRLRDITRFNTVEFWAYGEAEIQFKVQTENVYTHTYQEYTVGTATSAAGEWNNLSFNYNNKYGEMFEEEFRTFRFVIDPESNSTSGTIYMDDMRYSNTADTTIPDAPVLDQPADNITSTGTFTITGNAESLAAVDIYINDEYNITAGVSRGTTQFSVPLYLSGISDGSLEVKAKTRDGGGNVSVYSSSITIVRDTTPPSAPSVDDLPASTTNNILVITGTGEPNGTLIPVVSVGENSWDQPEVTIDGSGNFTANAYIYGDNTTFYISAYQIDVAGNQGAESSQDEILLNDTVPPEAPLLDTLSSTTTANIVKITGTAEPNTYVTPYVTKDTDIWNQPEVWVDYDGTFTAYAYIYDDGNDFGVYAQLRDPGGSYGATCATQTIHLSDNNPPRQPIIERLPSWFYGWTMTTNVSSITITGTAEPNTRFIPIVKLGETETEQQEVTVGYDGVFTATCVLTNDGSTYDILGYCKDWAGISGPKSDAGNIHDFSNDTQFSADIYGDVDILAKFKDGNGDESGDIGTVSATDPNGWTHVVWDYSSVNWLSCDSNAVTDILFFIEPGEGYASGTFYMDNVWLGPNAPPQDSGQIIDNFDTGYSITDEQGVADGSWWTSMGDNKINLYYEDTTVRDGVGALKVEYDKKGDAWAYFQVGELTDTGLYDADDSKVLYDTTSPSEPTVVLSTGYITHINMWVDGTAEANARVYVKVEDPDGGVREYDSVWADGSGNWTAFAALVKYDYSHKDGVYKISAYQKDPSGNTSSESSQESITLEEYIP